MAACGHAAAAPHSDPRAHDARDQPHVPRRHLRRRHRRVAAAVVVAVVAVAVAVVRRRRRRRRLVSVGGAPHGDRAVEGVEHRLPRLSGVGVARVLGHVRRRRAEHTAQRGVARGVAAARSRPRGAEEGAEEGGRPRVQALADAARRVEEEERDPRVERRRSGTDVREDGGAQRARQRVGRQAAQQVGERLGGELADVGGGVGEERAVRGEGGGEVGEQLAEEVLEEVAQRREDVLELLDLRRPQQLDEAREQRAELGVELLAQVDGERRRHLEHRPQRDRRRRREVRADAREDAAAAAQDQRQREQQRAELLAEGDVRRRQVLVRPALERHERVRPAGVRLVAQVGEVDAQPERLVDRRRGTSAARTTGRRICASSPACPSTS